MTDSKIESAKKMLACRVLSEEEPQRVYSYAVPLGSCLCARLAYDSEAAPGVSDSGVVLGYRAFTTLCGPSGRGSLYPGASRALFAP